MNASSRPRSVEVRAQAKLNLRLRILARETSGYHQLETLFHRIELADVIRIRRTRGERTLDIAGDVDLAAIGPVQSNLAWRAAESYLAATGTPGGFAIELEKQIPVGGGLGGGSADAGAVLRSLDAMAESPLGESRLLQLATGLGADVPFLASQHAYALAWGRGERMMALKPLPAREVLLLMPAFGVSTVDAFGWLAVHRAQRDTPHGVEGLVLHPWQLERWEGLEHIAINDFEGVVAERHPDIALLLAGHRASPSVELAMLSGSGSTVFAIVRDGATQVLAQPMALRVARSMTTRTASRVEPPTPIE